MSSEILNQETAHKKLRRLALEIVEKNMGEKEIHLYGIKENGWLIATILHDYLKEIFSGIITVSPISIDKKNPKSVEINTTRDLNDQVIIVVDDVVNSGRTLLYALHPFLKDYPKKIQTLVLVERSYKAFPISADYVGMSVSTALSEKIVVHVNEHGVISAQLEK